MTAALDFLHPAPLVPSGEVDGDVRRLRLVRAETIPLQVSPAVTVSLTEGCDVPLEALRAAPERAVSCHPCDQAVVALLLARIRRPQLPFTVSSDIRPGTLQIS